MKKKLIVNCDGLCEPVNPAGIACYGFVVKQDKGKVLYADYGLVSSLKPFFPESNSNAAEYGSVIEAMKWLVKKGYIDNNGDYQILIRGDCQVIMRKLNSINYSSRAAIINPLYDGAVRLRSMFSPDVLTFEWIKRDQNIVADKLAKEGYYWVLRKYPKLQKRVREHWVSMLWLEQMMYINV